jgi:hypothetical protein
MAIAQSAKGNGSELNVFFPVAAMFQSIVMVSNTPHFVTVVIYSRDLLFTGANVVNINKGLNLLNSFAVSYGCGQ